jgi:DNA-3-methyladenine glycosylase
MLKRSLPRSKPQIADTSACAPAALVRRAFFLDPPDVVARKLLGKLLVRPGEQLVGRIVEVEAYFGELDPASHSYPGKTARNAVLFGPPGHAYVYFIYGMYFCLNVSCEPEGRAGGILFRALEPLCGLEAMAIGRGLAAPVQAGKAATILTSGPGRLCQAFGITRERDNGVDFTARKSDLQIQDDGFVAKEVLVTRRIGITKDAERAARFLIAGNPYVSGPKG